MCTHTLQPVKHWIQSIFRVYKCQNIETINWFDFPPWIHKYVHSIHQRSHCKDTRLCVIPCDILKYSGRVQNGSIMSKRLKDFLFNENTHCLKLCNYFLANENSLLGNAGNILFLSFLYNGPCSFQLEAYNYLILTWNKLK